MSVALARHKFSVAEYEQMIQSGYIREDARVELIRGEILNKMPIGDAHVEAVNRLNRKFAKLLADSVTVSVQNPLLLADSEPEPDIALYTLRAPGKARPPDVHLVVEVADTSLDFDRTVKLALYAEAGIREYWIVNLLDEQVEVHRQPQIDGSYALVAAFKRGDVLEPAVFPGVKLAVDEILL